MRQKVNKTSRRQFIASSALGVAGITLLPSGYGWAQSPADVPANATSPMPATLKKIVEESHYAHKEMVADLAQCAETRWLHKKVDDAITIFDSQQIERVKVTGQATISLASEITYEGKNCVCLTADTQIENIQPRPSCGVEITLDKSDLSAFNRISAWIYPQMTGFQNLYVHFNLGNPGKSQLHAPCLLPNTWNRVTWEIADVARNAAGKMQISPYLGGCPPEALPVLKFYIGPIYAEKVEVDDDFGWELKERIAYCHSGYLPHMKKIAIAQNVSDSVFRLCDARNKVVYQHPVRAVHHPSGVYYELDFSDFNVCGTYYIKVGNRQTPLFVIDPQALDSSIWKSINFLRSLRCGEDVDGVHSACHLHCKVTHPQTQATVPSFGGWHDAGDLSQFEICTAEMAHAVLALAIKVKDKDAMLYHRLLEEGKVGISWLLRTRFGDGTRALAVSYGMWRSNVLTTDNDSVKRSTAENGPFENFLASAACAFAAGVYRETDVLFADWCLRVAAADFHSGSDGYQKGIYSRRWGTNIDAQVCGAGALAAAELYACTGKEEYAEAGARYAQIILSCQKREYPDWKIPVRGFFYENPAQTKTLSYEHRGHEQSPIHGLARLMEIFPQHPDRNQWKTGLELYGEYIRQTCALAPLYQILPAHIYELDKINMERFTVSAGDGAIERAYADVQAQIRGGIPLSDNAYLRIFPAAPQRRGFHATLLSKAKAVSLTGRMLHDAGLLQVAMNQIEWILGKNPFASSTMYGEGHNYHPLYVAFSRQIVGSLPVGIKTKGDTDAPYWPVINNAVYKEIWGHTTGKYLFVLADLV